MSRRLTACVVVLALMVFGSVALAGTTVEGPTLKMRLKDAEAAMINSPNRFTQGTNGQSWVQYMTINPATGTLYGNHSYIPNNGGQQWFTFASDNSVISKPSAPVDALTGMTRTPGGYADNNMYVGAVRGGNQGTHSGGIMGWNSNVNEGVPLLLYRGGYRYAAVSEWAVQDASVGWGHTVEGTTASKINTNAMYASAQASANHGYGTGIPAGAYLDRTTVTGAGAGLKDRILYYFTNYGGSDRIEVDHLDTGFVTTPTDTSAGGRTLALRPGTSQLMNQTDILGLRPSGTIQAMAVRGKVLNDVYDLYFLFRDDSSTPSTFTDDKTYLAGARATIPSDGSAMSWLPINLGGTNNYIELMDTVANKDVSGAGMAFSGDGNTLYVAGYLPYSTSHPTYDQGRFYIFDVQAPAGPVAEPAALALALLGLPILARRRRV